MAGASINRTKLIVRVSAMSSEAARRAANRVALRARGSIIGQGRYATGEMMSGFRVTDVTKDPTRPTWRVRNVSKHFVFQNQGTPRDAPGVGYIYPRKPGGRLVFRPKGSARLVFARRVRGVKPGLFLQRAVAATRKKDFTDPL